MIFKFENWLNESVSIGNGNVVVKINTQDEYWILMKYLDTLDYYWDSAHPASSVNYYLHSYSRNKIGYGVRIGDNKDLGYSAFDFYVNNNTFKDYIKVDFKDLNLDKKYKRIENPNDIYGEDDWGYEEIKESLDLSSKSNYIIRIDTHEEYWEAMEFLEKLGYYWGISEPPRSHDYFNEYENFCICTNTGNRLGYGRWGFFSNDSYYFNYEKFNWKDIISGKIKNYKRIDRPDLDPYNEEDWGYEELKESLESLESLESMEFFSGYAIRVDTQEEYWDLMKNLEKFGYTWTGDPPTSRDYFNKYEDLCIFLEHDKYLSYSDYKWFLREGHKIVNYKEIANKKYKRIENPEDIYGEDDWGYIEED